MQERIEIALRAVHVGLSKVEIALLPGVHSAALEQRVRRDCTLLRALLGYAFLDPLKLVGVHATSGFSRFDAPSRFLAVLD
jgi:hypothetical protein